MKKQERLAKIRASADQDVARQAVIGRRWAEDPGPGQGRGSLASASVRYYPSVDRASLSRQCRRTKKVHSCDVPPRGKAGAVDEISAVALLLWLFSVRFISVSHLISQNFT